ncbi:hypothetical protein BgiMline_011930 [Biomphalaria glabrata]|nr:isatin hydrolase [Biomphalaria glabrata]
MYIERTIPFNVWVCFITSVASVQSNDNTYIDLSHPQSATTIYWPGQPRFNRTVVAKGSNENNVWIEVGAYNSGEHGGTHMDAPRHFYPTGFDLKDLPLERTIADGVMIDVRSEAEANIDYQLTVEKLLAWEENHGRLPPRAAVVVNNGWTSRWPDPLSFFGTKNGNNYTSFHFPIVSIEAAEWLLQNRDLKILALDVPSPDGATDDKFPVHQLLLSRNIIIVENVMVPNTLPARGFRFHAAPIRIEGGTGVQTRVYAILNDASSCANEIPPTFLLLLFLAAAAVFNYRRLAV